MAGQLIARLGDTSSHGGKIVTAAERTFVEGQPAARLTDLLACPIHGLVAITTGSPRFPVESQLCAHTLSKTTCNANIESLATRSFCEPG